MCAQEPGEDTFVLPIERDAIAQLMSNLDDSNPEVRRWDGWQNPAVTLGLAKPCPDDPTPEL
jgi:hypothetical protein